MALRTFIDPSGTEWAVWAVYPHAHREQRARADRRRSAAPDPIIERRRTPERRTVVDPRVNAVRSELAGGWLCFDARGAKRRLAPVPPDWEHASEATLAAYCTRAQPAARASRTA